MRHRLALGLLNSSGWCKRQAERTQ